MQPSALNPANAPDQEIIAWLEDRSKREEWTNVFFEGAASAYRKSLHSEYIPGQGHTNLRTTILARMLSDQYLDDRHVDFILESLRNYRQSATPGVEIITCSLMGATSIQERVRQELVDGHIYRILLPFCYRNRHWLAVDANMEERSCLVYDSLHNACDRGGIEKDMELVLDRLGKPAEKGSGWIFQYPDCPQQLDVSSCGVAMVNTIDWIAHQNVSRWIPNQPGLMRASYYRMCVDGVLPEVIPHLTSYWLVAE